MLSSKTRLVDYKVTRRGYGFKFDHAYSLNLCLVNNLIYVAFISLVKMLFNFGPMFVEPFDFGSFWHICQICRPQRGVIEVF
jgi:hypothetical protein